MVEEEKKPEEKKMEEKKPEEEKPKEEKPIEESKDEKKTEESKDPPPAPEIVLKVYMHCEGCARKVRRCLKNFEGVEEIMTDCRTQKVVVKGAKADPLKVLARVQKKSHRQVELLSPIPKPEEKKEEKPEEKEPPKPEEKKEEPPQVIIVVLKVHMHCEACAQAIKKRIERMKGVENADPDLKSSQVTVKGIFDPAKLVEYVYKRTGRHVTIVKQEPAEKKDEENGKKPVEEEKKTDAGEKVAGDGEGEKKEGTEEAPAAEKQEGAAAETAPAEAPAPATAGEETKVMEVKKNEFLYYHPQQFQMHPQRYPAEFYYQQYPPQIFSDENPNACSVM